MIKTLQTEIAFSKAQKQAKLGNLKDSIQLYDKAISLAPKYSQIHLHKALALSAQEQYQEAIDVFKKAISLHPRNKAHHLFLGITYYDCGKLDDAIDAFEMALELSPENSLALCYKYLSLIAANERVEEAYTVLSENMGNTNAEFKGRLLVFCESFILQKKKDAMYLKEALFHESYSRTMRGKSLYYNVLERVLFKLGCFCITISHPFSRSKRNGYLYSMMGEIKLEQGELDNAEIEFRRALNNFPHCRGAEDNLLSLYIYKKNYEPAWEYVNQLEEYREISNIVYSGDEQALEEKGILRNHLSLISTLALLHFYTGEYDKSIKLLNIVVTLGGSDYYHLYYLGLCHLANNDPKQALIYFQCAMGKINPNVANRRLDEMVRLYRKR